MSSLAVSASSFVRLQGSQLKDHYIIRQKIHLGTISSIRRLTHKTTGDERIVKTVHKQVLRTQAEHDRLLTQFNILKSLDHPNIIKMYEYYEDSKNYYFVSEYCSGGDLFNRIINQGFITEAIAAEHMRQILSVLAYMHKKGIVHRDLKPESFLLDSTATNAMLKLSEFSTATYLEPGATLSEAYGTAYYISPEMLRDPIRYDFKADIWSSGVILYILLSGVPPFNGSTETIIKRKIISGRFPFPSPEFDLISFEGKDFITQLLNVNPSERPSAQAALEHPWISFANKKPISELHAETIFKNIENFRAETGLHKAALSFIVSQFVNQQESSELFEVFKSLDLDNSGTLSKSELVAGFKKVFPEATGDQEEIEANIDAIFTQIDVDGSGEVDYSEFILATADRQKLISKERVKLAFDAIDTQHHSAIDAAELRSLFGGLKQYDEAFWNSIIQEVDLNHDGMIDFEEFTNMMWRLTN